MFHGEIRKKLFRKNYFKLLLLGLVTPLLCGMSFAINLSSNDLDYLDSISLATGSFSNIHTKNLYVFTDNVSNSNIRNVCIVFSGLTATDNFSSVFGVVMVSAAPGSKLSTPLGLTYKPTTPYTLMCINGRRAYYNVGGTSSDTSITYSADKWWLFYADDLLNIRNSGGGDVSCDYSEYESTISTLSGSLATCQGNLSQCQASNCDTQLSQCLIDRDNALSSVSTLSGSLASCNEDKISLQNYNNSLSSQLDECLLGGSDNLTGDSCFDYSMFWHDSDSIFSLPITNNLFLPNGYKGKYDEDNVLSIAKINSLEAAYQFSDEDKVTIIDILSIVMLFLLATGSLIGLIVFLKRLVINRK